VSCDRAALRLMLVIAIEWQQCAIHSVRDCPHLSAPERARARAEQDWARVKSRRLTLMRLALVGCEGGIDLDHRSLSEKTSSYVLGVTKPLPI
jgi:hypothetical protein